MTTPTFQDQMHFMSCQAELLDEQGNDVSAGVMRDASKVLVVEHKRALALDAEVSRLNEALTKATDTQCDQILKMTDKQIEALCRIEGHDPKDEALIAKQVCEIALLKHELSKVTKAPTEELSSSDEAHAALDRAEISRKHSRDAGKTWIEYSLAERIAILAGGYKLAETELEQLQAAHAATSDELPEDVRKRVGRAIADEIADDETDLIVSFGRVAAVAYTEGLNAIRSPRTHTPEPK